LTLSDECQRFLVFFLYFFYSCQRFLVFFFLVPALSGIYFIYLFVYSGRCGENGALEKMGFYLFIYCLFVCLFTQVVVERMGFKEFNMTKNYHAAVTWHKFSKVLSKVP